MTTKSDQIAAIERLVETLEVYDIANLKKNVEDACTAMITEGADFVGSHMERYVEAKARLQVFESVKEIAQNGLKSDYPDPCPEAMRIIDELAHHAQREAFSTSTCETRNLMKRAVAEQWFRYWLDPQAFNRGIRSYFKTK